MLAGMRIGTAHAGDNLGGWRFAIWRSAFKTVHKPARVSLSAMNRFGAKVPARVLRLSSGFLRARSVSGPECNTDRLQPSYAGRILRPYSGRCVVGDIRTATRAAFPAGIVMPPCF
jgi:hypothetical protein